MSRPGSIRSNVLTMRVSLPQEDTFGPPRADGVLPRRWREKSRPFPESASERDQSSAARRRRTPTGLSIEGRPAPAPGQPTGADFRIVCPGYFETLGIPIVTPAVISRPRTSASGEPVVIVSRAIAEQSSGRAADPIGQRFKLGGFASDNPWLRLSASSTTSITSRWNARRAARCSALTARRRGRS